MPEEMNAYGSVDEELNVQSKRILHDWLTRAIEDNDRKLFAHCVSVLGTSWNVKRTVKSSVFGGFVNHLWEKVPDIKDGSYRWQNEGEAFSYQSGGKTKHAYSYESKVCFAIAPTQYKIIYDTNTCKHLKAILHRQRSIVLATFADAVNEWCAANNIDTASEDALYRADYALWSGEAVVQANNGGNEK